ncbi:MAG: Wzz/FepE/Etk N-terminal domain-containing protein, partial [Acidobacteriota bacterium]
MDLNTQEVHLSHYWNVIYKRWRVAVAIIVVVLLATFLASYFAAPLYRSAIQIQIERENVNQITLEDLFGIQASDQEFLQTQYVLLKSRGLAARVIDDAKLLADADFYPQGIVGKTKAQITEIKESQVGRVQNSIVVTPVPNTSLVEVAYIATTPRLAQKIAEGLGNSYIQMKIDQKLESVHQASQFLTKQIGQVKGELDDVRSQLQRYGESKDIISVNDAGNITVQKLVQLNADYTTAQKERIDKEARFETISRASPDSVAGNDLLVQKISQDEERLQRDYSQKLATFRPEYPEMLKLKADIEKARQSRQTALQAAYAQMREA